MKKKILIYCGFIIVVLFSSCYKSKKADIIVHNAVIYSVDGNFTAYEAMAIGGDTILELGPNREILNRYTSDNIIDAKQGAVFPGFIDAHCHFLGYGMSLQQLDLVGTKSFKEVIERIESFSKTNKSKWIIGRGWDQNDWENKSFPSKDILDSLFPNTPIFIKRIDGHAALVNQKTFDIGKIKYGINIPGGIFEQKNGKLTGILIDNAIEVVEQLIPKPTEEEMKLALLLAQTNCFEVGITTIDEAGLNKSDIDLIDKLQSTNELKMKVYAMVSDNEENLNFYLNQKPIIKKNLTVRSVKVYGDGALGSRGACLLAPYSDVSDSANYGFLLKPIHNYIELAKKINTAGFQMNTHCIGDSANRLLLEIYGNVLKGTNDKRWRIEHCQVVDKQDLVKFRSYNIIPSVQPTHATSDMNWAEDRLGKDKINSAYSYKELFEQNGLLALGTDFPVENINPILTFYASVTRKDTSGFPENGFLVDNALSREEAIKGMTIGAAIANFEENTKGSLEVGKSADFVILDRDIMKISESAILQTKVVYTVVNGILVFKK